MSPPSIPATVLVADPPWSFGDSKPGGRPGAEKHYDVLSVKEVAEFPLPDLKKDAILFLWRVSSQVEEAYRVCRAWGFEPKSEIVWIKCTKSSKGDVVLTEDAVPFEADGLAMGLGHYVRGAHETCIIATRGKMKDKIRDHAVRTVFFAPVNEHSRKPQKFYEIVERMVWGESPALDATGEREAYRREAAIVELFARRERLGWECFGNELKVAHPIAREFDGWDKAEARVALDLAGVTLDELVADAKELWLPPGAASASTFTNCTPEGMEERVGTVKRAMAEGLLPPNSAFNDETWVKLCYEAPPGWFGVKRANENLSALAAALEKKGLRVPVLPDLAQWDPLDRQAAIAWVRGHIRTTPPIIAALGKLPPIEERPTEPESTPVPCAACDRGTSQDEDSAHKHTHPIEDANSAAAHRAQREKREAAKGKRKKKSDVPTTDTAPKGEPASAGEAPAPLPTTGKGRKKKAKPGEALMGALAAHTEHRPDGGGGFYVGAQNDPRASAWERAEAIASAELAS